MFQETDVVAGDFLRKFLLEIGGLPSLRDDVVRSMLYFESRGQVSREESSGQYGGGRKRSQRDGEIETCLGEKSITTKACLIWEEPVTICSYLLNVIFVSLEN